MDMKKLVKSIFQFVNRNGQTCLMILFDMMLRYRNKTRKYPDSTMPMFVRIESTALYLIKMAEKQKLNMDRILNWTANDGMTLFSYAAFFSETLSSQLLGRNIIVTTVDHSFQIPSFRVSYNCKYFVDFILH